jgi:hypothetical protein
MLEDFQEKQQRRMARTRSIMDFAMGCVLLIVGGVLILYKVGTLEELNRKMLGGLFILYGIWRIYRGYKKNYNR